MINAGVFPIRRIMTVSAVGPQRPIVNIFVLMAGIAVSGRPFIYAFDMTGRAAYRSVFVIQWESRLINMVDAGRRPGRRGMTTGTVSPQRAGVEIFGLVTRIAVLGRSFINLIGMAGVAVRTDMFSRQRVAGCLMIKCDLFPVRQGVAIRTLL
jgi:hypothetical protein